MKKVLKTVLIVLVVLVIALGITAYLNRGIVKAFLMAYTASEKELQDKLETGVVDSEVLSGYTDITLRDLTEEEKAKLVSNEISEEDAVALIMGMLDSSLPSESTENTGMTENTEQREETVNDVPVVQTPTDNVPPQEPPAVDNPPDKVEPDVTPAVKEDPKPSVEPESSVETESTSEPEKTGENTETPDITEPPVNNTEAPDETNQVNKKIAELVAKIYVVRARVMANFDAYIEELKTEYDADRSLTKEERRATKPQFASKAIKVVSKWEKECDTEINAILSEIETLLKDSGQSLELVDTIKKAYEDEKAAKKAYCINQYLD